jgi:hypothetical protein
MRDDDRRLYEKPGHLIRRLQQISLVKERKLLVEMLEKLVHLNNEHSRAPLRIGEEAG